MENTENTVATEQEQAQEQAKTYTQDEVNKLIQSETDKRVTEALKTAEKKNADKVKEAQRLASMNEQQKYEYELKQREDAIAAKEKELSLAENKNECSKILADKGLPIGFTDFVVSENADTMNENIKNIEKMFKSAVKNEVEKRLASSTPKKNLPLDNDVSKKDFKSMTYSQRMALAVSNPELYKQLNS